MKGIVIIYSIKIVDLRTKAVSWSKQLIKKLSHEIFILITVLFLKLLKHGLPNACIEVVLFSQKIKKKSCTFLEKNIAMRLDLFKINKIV